MSKRRIATSLIALGCALATQATAAPPPRERIGSSAGVPVYRDQLTGATVAERSDSVRTLLVTPALQEYFQAHRAEITPSHAEVAEVIAQLEAARACAPDYISNDAVAPETRALIARDLLAGRNVLRHVYKRFGGGRLLFQQGGVEAFDATRRLLEGLEAQGRITFEDPSLRALAYDYWTRDQGAWLIKDEAQIRHALEDPIVDACPAGGTRDDAGSDRVSG